MNLVDAILGKTILVNMQAMLKKFFIEFLMRIFKEQIFVFGKNQMK
jgi:hypothetical protein